MSKNNEIQRESEHNFAFPAKRQKCTYDLLAFNRRLITSDSTVQSTDHDSTVVLQNITKIGQTSSKLCINPIEKKVNLNSFLLEI